MGDRTLRTVTPAQTHSVVRGHEVDQFQVMVGGAGTIGRHRAAPGVVHYTDAFTAYGPIRTEHPKGVAYLTLRRDPALGLNYMPEERERRRRMAGRGEHFTEAVDERVAPGAARRGRRGRGTGAAGGGAVPARGVRAVSLSGNTGRPDGHRG